MIAQICLSTMPVTVKAESPSVFTDYLPTIAQVTDDEGFTHPGVGLTKELLENLRSKIRTGAQPWTYYWNNMLLTAPEASRTVGSSNSRDGVTVLNDNFDSQGIEGRFIADGIKAYAQAMMYYITGDEVYRANAMMIIRIWEQMDPAKYAFYRDAHIHAGVPLNRMVMAAEILRYSSTQTASLAWTEQDTADFTNHLIIPVTETLLHDQNHFMNQHNYPLIGAISGYIFTGNRDRYNEAVEWFTVNRTANDQGFNGSIKALFRWVTEEEKPGTIVGEGTPVEPHVQHMEMGRDQAHGGGDLTNAAILTRLIHAQGTKIDPVTGTPSTADNALDIMEFLNHRLLGAANFFWQFMLGYDTPWTPQAYAITGGDPDNVGMGGYIRDTYNFLSPGYRGRFDTANFWDFYSYYTYVKQEDVSELAPYYYEAFTKKQPATPGMWGNKDAGNDFWLYLPAEAEADAAKFIPQDGTSGKTLHLEDRYTKLDNHTATMQEGDTRFIRFHATQEGSKIAALSFAGAAGSGPFGFKIRTSGVTTLDALGSTFTLPDTKGEWRYVSVAGTFENIVYMTVKGAPGVTVDVDSVDAAAATNLTPPVFKAGSTDLKIYTYIGASVNVDLSATDASSTDVITYELQNNSKGLPIDAHTGAFSWQPSEAGNYSVVLAATDGTTFSVKNVKIIVSSDRASAVQAIISSYDRNQVYVEATLNLFQAVYNNTLSQINTASEVDFDKQLQALRAATEGLTLVTPLTDFGMRWSKVVAWSSWGSLASNMDDGTNLTGAGFGLAQGSAPHLYYLLDFGTDYKVSATKFGFLSNIFVDRLANSTIYGSNDKLNWTRLTPGVTQYTQAYHTLDVDPAYQNEKYRYIKLEMIQPLPAVLYGTVSNIMEMTDFDVYGTRYEIGNKIQSISLSSDQALNGRVALGKPIKASISAKEAISNVKVKIQDQVATVSTTDNINWTATTILTGQDQSGDVKVSVDYTKQDGTNGDTLYATTDGSKLFAADDSDLITNAASLASLVGFSEADTLKQANYLFDNNASTNSEFRLDGSGAGSCMTFDFKEGNQVTLSNVELLARQDSGLFTRISGAVVQGSNDNNTWTTLTKAAASTADWQMLKVSDTKGYRYIRIYNANTWYGNMAEVRLHGVVKSLSKIASSSISSTQSLSNRIVPGSTVKLAFTAKEAINNVNVTIQGLAATVASTDNINWTAEATLNQGAATGTVNFAITYNQQDGAVGFPIHTTTDNSTLFLVDESDLIKNITGITNLIDSTSGRTAPDTLTQVNYLFDNNAGTGSDFRLNGSGSGSYITFDFKEGNLVTLSSVELLGRTLYDRIRGAVVQGSNDNTTWTTLTTAAVSTPNWQTLPVSGNVPYRYIRIYNGNAWYGNMAEVRFHGKVESLNRIESTSISSAQSIMNRIVPGNTVKLAIVAKEPIKDVKVAIQGQNATVSSTDNINWTATASMNQGVAAGPVKFTILYNKQDGTAGYPAPQTTDNTSLYLVDESDVVKNVTSIANLIDSTSGRSVAQTLQQVNTLFDGNASTGSDFRIGSNNSGSGSSIVFDFKAGNQAALTNVELLARQDQYYTRINGAVIQGSNDNTTWTTLTKAAVSTKDWQNLTVSSKVPYRYIKIVNPNAWFGNINEVRFHGVVKAADVTPPVTTDDAPQGPVNKDTTVSFNATDDNSGVAATYYKVDSGAEQTGNTVTLTTYGTHTLVYWSVDWADNVEQQHTVTLNLDKTAPDLAGLYADITVPTNKDVTVTIYYPNDVVLTEYKVGDNGEWTAYTGPVTVSENVTVYARSTDAAGNVSDVASYTVSNIYMTAPSDAILTADITGPINGNVTLTISYPDNVALKEYKVGDNGTWAAYASPVTVSDNVTVSARSKDIAGNVSNVTSYTVSNIDRVPPAEAVLSADITPPTNQDVTVTVTYPSDVAVKEYSVGETGVWTAYGAPVVISENSTMYARGKDAAGNVSNVTQYTVGNIDRIPPADAILAVDTTAPTNQGVTVTITYPEDAAVKEYKVGDSGMWTAYTALIVVQNNDTVYARGTDAVGNVSNVTSAVVSNIWKVAPVTTATLSPATPNGKNSWYWTDVTVSLSVYASVYGGTVKTEYQVNDGDWIVYTGSIPAFGDGAYKLGYRSTDESGNVEQLKTIEFKVDKTAPVLSVQLGKMSIWPPNHKMVPINATLLSSDDGSEIESVVLTSITSNLPDSGRGGDIQANFGTGDTSFSVRAEKGSIYTITYTAIDKAGNKTVVTATVTVPHDQSGIH
ncbi:OmpL47-type beta-barrel domain-containing protein [Paenibacillus allorhizoplanae]|nr:discoidin domain-containing protein [Paenibacillus allorhizoplanae]